MRKFLSARSFFERAFERILFSQSAKTLASAQLFLLLRAHSDQRPAHADSVQTVQVPAQIRYLIPAGLFDFSRARRNGNDCKTFVIALQGHKQYARKKGRQRTAAGHLPAEKQFLFPQHIRIQGKCAIAKGKKFCLAAFQTAFFFGYKNTAAKSAAPFFRRNAAFKFASAARAQRQIGTKIAARQAILRCKKCGHTAGKSRSYSVTDFKQRSHTPYYRPRR